MYPARPVKSGSNRQSKISRSSSISTSTDVPFYLSILKRAASKLHALDSHLDETLRLLFRSLTPAKRADLIGNLQKLNNACGSLYVRSLRINKSRRCSKTDFTTLPFSGG